MKHYWILYSQIILFSISFSIPSGCQQTSSDILLRINIDEIKDTPITYSDLFKDYKVIPLYPSGESNIGEIDELILGDDIIIAFDRDKYKGVLLFDIDGNLVAEIKNRGRGPGEYNNISGFDVDINSEQIFLFDWPHKVCIYNLKGAHIKDVKFNNGFTDLAYVDSKFLLCNTKDAEPTLLVTNQSGKILKSIDDIPMINRYNVLFFRRGGDFFKCEDKTILSFPFDQTIYTIEKNNLIPYVQVKSEKFGNRTNNSKKPTVMEIGRMDYLTSFSENDNLIFFQIVKTNEFAFKKYFYQKNKSKAICAELKDNMTFTSPEFLQLSGDNMITYLRPESILRLKEKIAKGALKVPEKMAIELNKINYDNYYPILIIYDLKKDFFF